MKNTINVDVKFHFNQLKMKDKQTEIVQNLKS